MSLRASPSWRAALRDGSAPPPRPPPGPALSPRSPRALGPLSRRVGALGLALSYGMQRRHLSGRLQTYALFFRGSVGLEPTPPLPSALALAPRHRPSAAQAAATLHLALPTATGSAAALHLVLPTATCSAAPATSSAASLHLALAAATRPAAAHAAAALHLALAAATRPCTRPAATRPSAAHAAAALHLVLAAATRPSAAHAAAAAPLHLMFPRRRLHHSPAT